MNYFKCTFILCLSMTFFTSCSDDIDELKKIDGDWKLETISGGIGGGGILVDGEITMNVDGDDLELYRDDTLIMEADISYEEAENAQIFLNIDVNYLEEMPTFTFGGNDKMVIFKTENNLNLWDNTNDGYSYDFVKN